MRSANVYVNELLAASLSQDDDGSYLLRYDNSYLEGSAKKPISLTLPLSTEPYHSKTLFPFFFNLLPEGSNKRTLCSLHRIDPEDYFSILVQVAGTDTVGAVRVKPSPIDHE